MSDPQIPQLTDLGERLARDNDRTYLESLLERLSEQTSSTADNALGNTLQGKRVAHTRQEAIKSARHILQTVWSMQHMETLTKQP